MVLGLVCLLRGDKVGATDEAAWTQAEVKLCRRVPAEFPIVRADPFLVTGDIGAPVLRGLVERTVRPCTEALYREFFQKRPDFIITIFLFKDDESYRSWSRKLFAQEPTTKFGYYLAGEQALLMNIATGSGTLVHEMVHPLMAVDFPRSPAWFNEGMGSLFEQCVIREGPSIRGLVNWRLPILQQAIGTPAYVPLEKLLGTTPEEFYGLQGGAGYAEARYLLLYVQEQPLSGSGARPAGGMRTGGGTVPPQPTSAAGASTPKGTESLEQLYAHFREHFDEDPTGRKSLEAVLGKPLTEIESAWLSWVRTLRWPEAAP